MIGNEPGQPSADSDMTPMTQPRPTDDLNLLRASYVSAINTAVAADDMTTVQELAADYDSEATQMVADADAHLWRG